MVAKLSPLLDNMSHPMQDTLTALSGGEDYIGSKFMMQAKTTKGDTFICGKNKVHLAKL